jgi:hypothetical protein
MDLAPPVSKYWNLVLSDYRFIREGPVTLDFTGGLEYRCLSFFMFANHLRDYLETHQPGLTRKMLSDYVNSSEALRMCSDIANTT